MQVQAPTYHASSSVTEIWRAAVFVWKRPQQLFAMLGLQEGVSESVPSRASH